jgi:hypothetical protein
MLKDRTDIHQTIIDFFGNERKEGEVGLEIEVEGENVLHQAILNHWVIDKDGSLRNDSAEYKLCEPIPRDKVLPVLLYLYQKLDRAGTQILDSHRTGVHVHINVQQLTVKELYQFITLYLCIEELMVRWAGPKRVGNLFCLRASDAEGLVNLLSNALSSGNLQELHSDRVRYASLNVKAIQDYGSLEFRALRGGLITPQEIATWVTMILEIKDAALRFNNPREIIESFSGQGPEKFLENIGPTVNLLNFDNQEQLLRLGVRNAQEVAYCNKWLPAKVAKPEVNKEPKKEFDPFDPNNWAPVRLDDGEF